MATEYDAILLVSFGGPEAPDEVIPFMENVTRGRDVPRERLEEVSQHYFQFEGRSPINDQNRALKTALEARFAQDGPDLPIYWGNRNWHPMLPDTLAQMRDDGVRKALCFVTSAYSSYSGCRQYRENLAEAQAQVEGAPELDKIRVYYNHPGFLEPQVDFILEGLQTLPEAARDGAHIVFTTHSIPRSMSRHCDYEVQHYEACRLVMELLAEKAPLPGGGERPWQLVFNSRSGPEFVPWLEPDINDHLEDLAAKGVPGVVNVPIGFISDHMEVIYDLDVEAEETAQRLELPFARVATVGIDDRFVDMIRDLVLERTEDAAPKALGTRGPNHDFCPIDCCFTPEQELKPVVAAAPARRRPGS
ncbi:MAG: ferrochelatase [Nitriliruptoraceae bacterium]|nr:ferrochelatase [Nitriliruptoraceae bacterium]